MAATIFEEDEVYKLTEKGLVCGLVVESSEYMSSDDEEDEDNPYFERIRKGSVRVMWHPDGEEEVVPETKLKLADRSLMPGDVVRRLIEGQDSQRGFVRNTTVRCHLQILGKNKVICDVESARLQPLNDWEANKESGDVYLDSWVGRIEAVVENITFKLPDGARCMLNDEDHFNELCQLDDLVDLRESDSEFYNSSFYRGEKLKGTLSLLEPAKWLKTTKAHSPHSVRRNGDKEVVLQVEETQAKSVEVHWLCQGYARAEETCTTMTAPPRILKKDDLSRLKKLNCFEECVAQIGDKGFYTVREQDRVQTIIPKGNRPLAHYIIDAEKVGLCTGKQVEILNTAEENQGDAVDKDSEETTCEAEPDAASSAVGCRLSEQDSSDAGTVTTTSTDDASSAKETCLSLVNVDIQKEPLVEASTPVDEVDSCDSEYEDEGDDEYQSDTGSGVSGASAHSSMSSSSTSNKSRKTAKKKVVGLQVRGTKKKKVKRAKKAFERHRKRELFVGQTVPVEIVHTHSVAEVMWQDGHIEKNIPSTDLFPIHHLDELEFFPGDFVQPATGVASSNTYGVVESVDHAGRTCLVKWMKPYQVGKANKPDECIVSEEVSVYDIKDHPDYKFRPGNLVVRVGGYEGSPLQAAGQVYELRQDGAISIQWVDKSRSQCYPQELYLLGDELSDLNDSDLESDSEDDDLESFSSSGEESTDSWHTESEHEEEEEEDKEGADGDDDADGEDGEDKETEDKLCVRPEKKVELDQLLETAKTTLKKLEDTFSQNVEINCCTIHFYKDMLHIYKHCRYLDRLLCSQYFENPELLEVMGNIKQELKKERTAKLTKQVSEKYEANRSLVQEAAASAKAVGRTEVIEQAEEAALHTGEAAAKTTDGKVTNIPGAAAEACSAHKLNTESKEVNTVTLAGDFPKCDAEVSTEEDVLGQVVKGLVTKSLQREIEDLRKHIAQVGKASVTVKCEEATKGTQTASSLGDAAACDEAKDCDKSVQTESLSAAHQPMSGKTTCDKAVGTECQGKVLCQRACHLVAVQIVKVQSDLERKWQMLKKEGKLRILEEEEEEEEEREAADKADGDLDSNTVGCTTPTAAEKLQLNLDLRTSPSDKEEAFLLKSPVTPQTPAEVKAKLEYNKDGFTMLDSTPSGHRFKSAEHVPSDPKSFFTAVKKELKLIHSGLPKGIFVRGYEDRMDLLSVMIKGPSNTPYEDGLFFFDVQLPNDYPNSPPLLHFISYSSERLNPNLYEDGKVCVSLLGTWTGKGTEVWTSKSSLMQVLISIQALILVSEPYYNEAGYQKQKGTQQGAENSRMYNEMALLKLTQAMTKTLQNPPAVFSTKVMDHMKERGYGMVKRLEGWITDGGAPTTTNLPEFPLHPVSRGFKMTLRKHLDRLICALQEAGIDTATVQETS